MNNHSPISPILGRDNIWGPPKEPLSADCLNPTAKNGCGIVTSLAAMSRNSLDPLAVLYGRGSTRVYLSILANHVHSMVETLFPDSRTTFPGGNVMIHRANASRN